MSTPASEESPRPSRRTVVRGATLVSALGALLPGGRAWARPRTADSAPAVPPAPRDVDPDRWAACVKAARDMLQVGEDGSDLKLAHLKVLIDDGLPPTSRPAKVLVVGAGIAGMTAAWLLRRAGHEVTIIEANANRVGGRIKTYGTDTGLGPDSPFADPLQYGEAGAMRLPDFHPLTLALVDRLGLRRRLFHITDIDPDTGNQDAPVPGVQYRSFEGETWSNGPADTGFRPPDKVNRTWSRTNGIQVRRADYAVDPRPVNEGFGLTGEEAGRTTAALLDAALAEARGHLPDPTPGAGPATREEAQQWVEAWARLIEAYDRYSMWGYLKERAGLSDAAIEAIGTLENLTSRMPLSFLHSFQGRSMINPAATYWEIEGGSWRLPYALLPEVEDLLRPNRRAIRVHWRDPAEGGDGPAVRVVTTEEPPKETDEARQAAAPAGVVEEFTGDLAIITVPFSSLRHVQFEPALSYDKRRAVIEMHYDSATKVLLEFSRRWWEFDEADWERELEAVEPGLYQRMGGARGGAEPDAAAGTSRWLGAHPSVPGDGVSQRQRELYDGYGGPSPRIREADGFVGGGSVTDNPNRFAYYPSHPVPGSPGGVVLASYSWADDAARWDSMEDDERYVFALRGLEELHGERIKVFYTGHGATQSWLRNPYAFGEAAVFTPGQLVRFQPTVDRPEGPLHFAGEHTSLKHAWIEGALESAVRSALEVHAAAEARGSGAAADAVGTPAPVPGQGSASDGRGAEEPAEQRTTAG
ncbi:FAD-dependent oxidoreductase [Allostreptomyces psammosilenae]|uniref:Monoamine oxidase n=1 Tax=Allostreptomyces psammosilenae TaxID=1892865 RepID=A0A853A602_9ACTN|nr:FAD-dependent oxidoreductase [Allostreptomyces psammosilenae]NYI08274.1 monoamine oxidase [Allostreptomyces psammosilenae]